jgi:hypothetical protein
MAEDAEPVAGLRERRPAEQQRGGAEQAASGGYHGFLLPGAVSAAPVRRAWRAVGGGRKRLAFAAASG